MPDPLSARRVDIVTNRAWHSGAMAQLPLVFVMLSLVALLVVPLLVAHRITALRREIDEIGDPSRTLVTDVQYTLAREMSLLRGFLITENPDFLDQYQQLLARERLTFDRLQGPAHRLSPEVSQRFGELRTLALRWHREVATDEVIRRRDIPDDFAETVAFEQQLYEETLEAATRLDQVIVAATAAHTRRVRELERIGLVATTLLALLALLSVFLVAWLGRRVRLLGEEAERRRHEAEQAMESKARLIRGVTHDLKNPLGAVDGYAEILQLGIKGPLTPEQQHIVARMRASIRNVLDAVGDLLEFSRAEAELLRIERHPVDVRELVAEATENYRAAAEAARLALEVRLPEALPVPYTDARRAREILENLLSNAVKYTPEGGWIRVGAEPRDGNSSRPGDWVVISVRDSGPGIPTDQQERIFEEWTRLSTTPSRHGGSGVGLAISRHIARLMGGDVSVESEVEEGATFTLWLPLRSGPGASTPPHPAVRL